MIGSSDRTAFAYVVGIEGTVVRLNVRDGGHGRRSSVRGTTSPTLKVGARFGILAAGKILVAEVQELAFVDPVLAKSRDVGSDTATDPPLRQLRAVILGHFTSAPHTHGGGNEESPLRLQFVPGGLDTPALGAAAVPLGHDELRAMLSCDEADAFEVGTTIDTNQRVAVKLDDLLARHVAILGSTGQGKTSLVASVLQALAKQYPAMRCVVFDVHGEYASALQNLEGAAQVKVTRLGRSAKNRTAEDMSPIPYPAFGQDGLEALINPSDKAQRPALRWALARLPYTEWKGGGACLVGGTKAVLFDDGRADGAEDAAIAIRMLQDKAKPASQWPHLLTVGAIAAEFLALQMKEGRRIRDHFRYGHIVTLVRRVQQLCGDEEFARLVNCDPRLEIGKNDQYPFESARQSLVADVFGIGTPVAWGIHVLDLRAVGQTHLPFLLSGLLQALLRSAVQGDQRGDLSTLLVLEEAHQFARSSSMNPEDASELLPYERLAKEGRKFGLSLMVSTQRPSEISQSVLSQCGTWFCLRLASERDRECVRHASEWADRLLLQRIASLPKHEAIGFGSAFRVPVHLKLDKPQPPHNAPDAKFHERWLRARTEDASAEGQPPHEGGGRGESR